MRIITPSNASFLPSGQTAGGMIIATYEFSGTATADLVVPSFSLVNVPATGPYILSVYCICTASTAATGAIAFTLTYDTVGFITATCGLTSVDADANMVFEGVDEPAITLDWAISGFTTGSADFRLVASVVKLF